MWPWESSKVGGDRRPGMVKCAALQGPGTGAGQWAGQVAAMWSVQGQGRSQGGQSARL